MSTNKDEIIKLYNNNVSAQNIALQCNVSLRTVYRATRSLRVKKQIVQMYNRGIPVKDIAKQCKVGEDLVRQLTNTVSTVKEPKETQTEKYNWIMGDDFVSIVTLNKTHDTFYANKSHHLFPQIRQAVKVKDFDEAIRLINIKKAIQSKFGNLEIIDNSLYFQGIEIKTGLARRIIDSVADGEDVTVMAQFLEALLENPSNDVLNKLFEFLEHNDIRIIDGGYFLTYKRVRKDFNDFYTGKITNKVGETVKVLRNQVDERQHITCSYGLHVAAKSYLPNYHAGEGVVVECKVHPRDVVAVPGDFSYAKMRVCQYVVTRVVEDM